MDLAVAGAQRALERGQRQQVALRASDEPVGDRQQEIAERERQSCHVVQAPAQLGEAPGEPRAGGPSLVTGDDVLDAPVPR
ncbi:MAG: hypothetical protein ACR2LK_04075 [Solirubrobacteraceae bacterium]